MGKPIKVFVCGMKGLGKTTLLENLIYNNLEEQDIHPTIEDIYVASVETGKGARETLRLYDTEGIGTNSGENAEICLPKQFFSMADAFVLVYSVENRQSFEIIDILKRDIDKNREKREIAIIVIGIVGKTEGKRQVDPLFVSGWAAREKVKIFDCCISNRQSLFPPFVHLAKLSPQPAKTTFAPLGMVRKPKE